MFCGFEANIRRRVAPSRAVPFSPCLAGSSLSLARGICLVPLLVAALFFTSAETAFAGTYVTWEGSEPDKAATAWLISRFIDTEAEFQFLPPGSSIDAGTAFDTPTAKWRRTNTDTSFELALRDSNVSSDPRLNQIAEYIHLLEFLKWARPTDEAVLRVESGLAKLRTDFGVDIPPLPVFFQYFDQLYKSLDPSAQKVSSK